MSTSAKILVTGATGFTGSALCVALAESGYEVHGLSQRAHDGLAHVAYVGDLNDRHGLQCLMQAIRPQQVVHLAARAFVGSDDALGFYRANVLGTCNLLDAARACGVERVIVASSANVYGVPASAVPLHEACPTAPVSHYAASKLAMEHMARTYRDDFALIVTRPFNYTGPGQDPSYLVPKLVGYYRTRAASIQLGNLDVARDFTSLDDVVRAYLALLASDVLEATVNICSGRVTTLQELLDKLSALTGHYPEIVSTVALQRRHDIPVLCGDNRRLQAMTGWQPTQSIDDILSGMLVAN